MTFVSVVFRGLLRRPVRTGLTLIGISIGIAAVVALVGMSRGFETSWGAGLKSRGVDVVVNNMTTSLTPKKFRENTSERIAHLPHVAAVSRVLVELMGVENSSTMLVSGREWPGLSWENLKVLSGRLPKDAKEKVVVLGQTAAEVLKKKVGDPLQLETEELTVVGIVDGGAVVENGSVILSMALFQELTGNEGNVNVIDVRVTPNSTQEDIKQLCAEIDKLIPECRAQPAGQNIGNSQAYRFIRAMSWGTSLLAVLVGVLGVMNTMMMTVFERTHEICVLLALGWRRGRIVIMVLLESAMLGFFGGVLGVIIGVIGVKLLDTAPTIHGLVEPDLNPGLLSGAVVIAMIVGVVSGLIPAWRSSRFSPSVALQS